MQPCHVFESLWNDGASGGVRPTASVVRMEEGNMKAQLSLWAIIDRLQRQLERQGVSPAIADKAVALAVRQIASSGRH
jgi:hypothetical protein